MSPENCQTNAAECNLSTVGTSECPSNHGREDAAAFLSEASNIVALKFGGSSLLGGERILHVAGLVRQAAEKSRVAVVVSAIQGITDRLLAIAQLVTQGKQVDSIGESGEVCTFHRKVLADLQLEPKLRRSASVKLQTLAGELLQLSARECTATHSELSDCIVSYGERFSACLVAAALEKMSLSAVPVASSDFLLTGDIFCQAEPKLPETRVAGRNLLLPLLKKGIIPVVTGFFGATHDGRVTTLGRNSSDFSGAIVAYVLDAKELIVWTDVDGIYSANPRESKEAQLLHELSYEEAYALAMKGAKVLHAKVLPLAARMGMTVWVRNTFDPLAPGTRIRSLKLHPQNGAA
jgi:bifunctional aspartokinase / homoserine dehydrogenase 1